MNDLKFIWKYGGFAPRFLICIIITWVIEVSFLIYLIATK